MGACHKCAIPSYCLHECAVRELDPRLYIQINSHGLSLFRQQVNKGEYSVADGLLTDAFIFSLPPNNKRLTIYL